MKIKISDIHIGDRFMDLDQRNVDSLKAMIAEQGLLNPITLVRFDGRFTLVAGRHRLEACKQLGRTEISYSLLDTAEAGTDAEWQKDMMLSAELGENMARRSLDRHESLRHGAAFGDVTVRIESRRKKKQVQELDTQAAERQAMAKATHDKAEKERLRKEAEVLANSRRRREKEVEQIEAYLEEPSTSGVPTHRKCSGPEGNRPELPREVKTAVDAAVGLALNVSPEHAKKMRLYHDALGEEFMALFANTKFGTEISDRAYISFAKEFPELAAKHKAHLIARAKVWAAKGDAVQRWKDDDVRWQSNDMHPWNGIHGGTKKANNADVKRLIIDATRTAEQASAEAVYEVVKLLYDASDKITEANNRCTVAKSGLLGPKLTAELKTIHKRLIDLRTSSQAFLMAAKQDARNSVDAAAVNRSKAARVEAADTIAVVNKEQPG